MPYHRHNTRLPPTRYLGCRTYFVTICCDQRKPHLRSPVFAQRVLRLLHECAANYSLLLHAFCIMPDHLHLLAQGTEPHADLREFIRIFKQHTAFAFRKSSRHRLWEKGFYDYVLRPSDRIEGVACYIWWNPVRKQLCTVPQEFPFTGLQTIDWMKQSAVAWDFDKGIGENSGFRSIEETDIRRLRIHKDEHGKTSYFLDNPATANKIQVIRLVQFLKDPLGLEFREDSAT